MSRFTKTASGESRSEMLSVRIPTHLLKRIEDYAKRFGISKTDSVILALYRGFGDQRGILTRQIKTGDVAPGGGVYVENLDGSFSLAVPRRVQQGARRDPLPPLPDPLEGADDNPGGA